MMVMDRAVLHHSLSDLEISNSVKYFFTAKFKNDARVLIDSEEFQAMNPKLQNLMLDMILKKFYVTFDIIFRGCCDSFKREIFKNCRFMMFNKKMNC